MQKMPFGGLNTPNNFPLEPGLIVKKWANGFHQSGSAANNLTSNYTVTAKASGTGAISGAVNGGALRIANATTDESSGANVRGVAYFKPLNERFGLFDSFYLVGASNALNSRIYLGWSNADTELVGGVTSFIGFRKVTGDNTVKAVYVVAGSDVVAVDVKELANAERCTFSIAVSLNENGLGTTTWYVNGNKVYSYEHTAAHVITTAFHGAVIQCESGTGGADAQTFDIGLHEGWAVIEAVDPAA